MVPNSGLKVIQGENKKTISLKAIGQDPLVRRFFKYVKRHDLRERAYEIICQKLAKKKY